MTFHSFQTLVLDHIRSRLRNGEWTERGFARRVGISQPHIHNILNGTRPLTQEKADRILTHLSLDLLALAGAAELHRALESLDPETEGARMVPVAAGTLAPGLPCPSSGVVAECITLLGRRGAWVSGLREPLFVRVGEDASMRWPGASPRMVLLETSLEGRRQPNPEAWYAVRLPAGGALRRIRWKPPVLTLLGQISLLDPDPSGEIDLGLNALERVLLGRVVWAGQSPARRFELDQSLWPRASR
jgi:hypothetical protein